ncbi:hypothetical protein M413DRAFT_154722 [Hebeloma cylindrosporum]|uniref:Zinc-finger domain-containing protein n=1 Tax=Hebeloma cylindrosporum TaxID=76867 RepID=A0A0C3BW61_HEBCY|nr:hypothetical protein M413DRAFT_154722 [Hebeloma cylindrosporum h7]
MTPPLRKQDERKQHLSETSNLNNNSTGDNDFSTYLSPFEMFPLLRDYPGSMLLSDPVSSLSSVSASYMYPSTRSSLSSIPSFVYAEHSAPPHSSPPSSPTVFLPDLKPLKLASLVKSLDPFKRLCHYEVPGGGTCRDDGCEDVHLSRGANQMGQLEPTGT